ncbi:hypothetical protein D3C76_1081330 [compost metagenome]
MIVSKDRTSVNVLAEISLPASTPIVIKPLFLSPRIVMNIPIPTVMACFKLSGMAVSKICRTRVTVSRMKIKPEINTAVRPICQVNGCSEVAEDKITEAKYALSPIPGANATGKFINTPIAMVKIPAASAVARNTEYQPISMRPNAVNVLGLTDRM